MRRYSCFFVIWIAVFFVHGRAMAFPTEEELEFRQTIDQLYSKFDQTKETFSEALGFFLLGHYLNEDYPLFLDEQSILQGMKKAAYRQAPPMDKNQFFQISGEWQEQIRYYQAKENLKQATQFLEENARRSTVVVLQDGKVQYEQLQPGRGQQINETSSPTVNYSARYLDGTLLLEQIQTALPMGDMIPGLQQGIIGMKEGEKRRIYLHPDLAYKDTPGIFPPNALLVFDVEVFNENGAVG